MVAVALKCEPNVLTQSAFGKANGLYGENAFANELTKQASIVLTLGWQDRLESS